MAPACALPVDVEAFELKLASAEPVVSELPSI